MKRLAILGSTGSIGVSTLDVVSRYPESYRVISLAAGSNVELMAEQIRRFRPLVASLRTPEDTARLRALLGETETRLLCGEEGAVACAVEEGPDLVVSAMVGAAGLRPTMAALQAGINVALANKEVLVAAGNLVMETTARTGATLFPVDSEHSAIFQSLQGHNHREVRRLILTASGGPFLHRDRSTFELIRPEEAIAHPNWSMGRKISIDSATMMNKGLEVIEARWLFDLPAERIEVVIHPQSIVHSMVEYCDGSIIAQLGPPDMRGPISYALAFPQRLPLDLPPLDFARIGQLNFLNPDVEAFPCLSLAYHALRTGTGATAALNAANEIGVAAFLERRISFPSIGRLIGELLDRYQPQNPGGLEEVLEIDRRARHISEEVISSWSNQC